MPEVSHRVGREDEHFQSFEFGASHPATVLSAVRVRRWPIVLGILVLLTVAGAGYLYYFQRELVDQWLAKSPLAVTPSATQVQVYKWRDRQGVWQITDKPPPEGVRYEVLEYRSDTNVMPLVPHEDR